jgi:hypothetical protein
LNQAEDTDDDYSDDHQGKEVAKGKRRKVSPLRQCTAAHLTNFDKIEDSDDDDDYREGEVRERHDLSSEALKLYAKTQTRPGLRRGFYKYGEGRVLAESGVSDSGREQRLAPTPPEEEGKGAESTKSAIEFPSAKCQENDVGSSTANSN